VTASIAPALVDAAQGPALHIPDGFLSTEVAAAGYVAAGFALAVAVRRTDRQLDERAVPLMGVMAAFIFAAQMMNFPVAGGTSGHMLGGALAAILLGPAAAILVMTAVIGLQALLFQDGGLVVLGANIFNMGVLTSLVGWAVYRALAPLQRFHPAALTVAVFAAGWLSVELSAVSTAFQLAISDTSPLRVALPAMAGVHALIGIGEGLVSAAAFAFVLGTRPDLVQLQRGASSSSPTALEDAPTAPSLDRGSAAGIVGVGLAIALGIALLSPLASGDPDGLERVAEDEGFIATAEDSRYEILPGYSIPGIDNEAASTALAGLVGVVVLGGAVLLLAETRRKRRATDARELSDHAGETSSHGSALIYRSPEAAAPETRTKAARPRMSAREALFAERHIERDSPLHRMDARVKLPAALLYVVAITLTDPGHWATLLLLALPLVLLVASSRLPLGLVLFRSALGFPFVLAAVPLMFTKPGDELFTLPLLGWDASVEGVDAVATIFVKSWLAVLVGVLLTSTTAVGELLRGLRAMRLPKLLVAVVFFTYRYLNVIGSEGQRMMRARDSRAAELPGYKSGGTLRWRARVMGYMVGSLFTRSLERGERVHAAMQARGYDGESRFLSSPRLRPIEIAAAGVFVTYGALIQLGAQL
jgi:cobalt/nickel transport system permease protein